MPHEKLFKLKILRDRTDNEGERAAADAALQRGLDRAGLVEQDLKPPKPAWPPGKPPVGARVMTPFGLGTMMPDGRVRLDGPPPMPQPFIQVQVFGGFGGFSTTASTDTSTNGFSFNF